MIVVGGGVIGLAVAERLRLESADVLVLDAGETGAWHVAAGMLAPISEADFGEDALLELGLESARRYPAFCGRLGVARHEKGTLAIARDDDEAAELERLHALHERLGLPVARLLPSAARQREPALAPTVRLALETPADHAVDPRELHAALAEGATIRRARATAIEDGAVTLAGTAAEGGGRGSTLTAPHVVVAAGAWSGALGLPVRPVGGQVIRLRDPRGAGLVERVIRTPSGYFVPRPDGRYVLGATVEERGWELAPTAGGTFELLRDLGEVVPGVYELEIEAVLSSARPGSPDNAPLIGLAPGCERTIVATGHYRNGVLLAPLTADLVCGLVSGVPDPDARLLDATAPGRFASQEVPA